MLKASVIIPVYNVEQYLRQCLDSVVKQTLKDIEIILVDDGSTDKSGVICDEYRNYDPRIVVIHQSNQGLAAARQTGLDAAEGEYIGFVDSDDWLEPKMFEEMYSAGKNYDADIVFCNTYRNESKKEQPYFRSGYYDREGIITTIFPRLLAGFNVDGSENTIRWCNWLRLYKTSIIRENNITFDSRFRRCQDLPFTFECTLCAQSYYYLGDRYLYHNRMNYESLSKGYTNNMWGLIKPLVQYLQDIVNNYEDYDFQEQMNCRAALFVFECCENENKPNNKKDLSERLRTIREIMNDPDAQKWVRGMKIANMRKINKIYQISFILKYPWLFYKAADMRFNGRRKEYRRIQNEL